MPPTQSVMFEQSRSYRGPVIMLVAATCAASTAGVLMERDGAASIGTGRPHPVPRPRSQQGRGMRALVRSRQTTG